MRAAISILAGRTLGLSRADVRRKTVAKELLFAAQPLLRQGRKILSPTLVALLVQRLQVGPGIEAGVVAVVEYDAHGVVADWVQLLDLDAALPRDRHPLSGRMALHLCRRAHHAQHLGRQRER